MDNLKEKYIRLMEEKGLRCSESPVVMELNEDDDKAIIEEHIKQNFTLVCSADSLGLEEFVEIQRTAEGMEGNVLIRGQDYTGKALYFEVTKINPYTVQRALRRLDKFYIHVTGKDQAEIAGQLKSFFTIDEAESKHVETGYGDVYREGDNYCVNAIVNNRLGLHARPSALLIKEAMRYDSDIKIIKGEEEVNGKSILNVMMLAANKGTELTIKARGNDAEEAVSRLYNMISNLKDED